MKTLIYCVWLVMIVGCKYPCDSVLIGNLDAVHTVSSDDVSIEFALENGDDVDISAMSPDELLELNELVYSVSEVETVRHVLFYVPNNIDTWGKITGVYGDSPNDVIGMQVYMTRFGPYWIVVNPDCWKECTARQIGEFFIHELMHQIVFVKEGTFDTEHELNEYWGDDGMRHRIFVMYFDQCDL